ncbi:MAG: ATP-dependent DNA helicase [Candidatus Hydrothermarchaeota archaeon]
MLDVKFFPYEPWENQVETIEFIQKSLRNKDVCLNAITGFGKTPVILAALLPLALKQEKHIIWAVRTGNETDRPIEELKIINSFLGEDILGISYRGKKDMCLLLHELKMDKQVDWQDVSLFCKTKQKDCKYKKNYDSSDLIEKISEPMLYSEIIDFCSYEEICPYKAQSDLLPYSTVIGLNYNYIIDEKISWGIRSKISFKNSFLVVDEAHNLQNAFSNLNSHKITLGSIWNAMKELKQYEEWKGFEEVKENLEIMAKGLRELNIEEETEFDAKCFLKLFDQDFEESLKNMQRFGNHTRKKKLREGKRPRSSLYHLGTFWRFLIEAIDIDGIAFIAKKERRNVSIEIWDMRAKEILKDRWKIFSRCIFCSGTLNPINAFAETIGLDNYAGNSVPASYNQKNVKSLVIKGVSTKGEELSDEMKRKYVECISDFLELNANLAIFSASYRIQEDLIDAGLKDVISSHGRRLFMERQGMSGKESRKTLDDFKKCANKNVKGVLCATQTGRFAEGADFPGKELEGIFLVGIPFEKMTVKTRLYLDYYNRLYGKEKGTYYAYIVPALRRASQSLGRALRSEYDRAVFILGDERYKEERFFRLLPDFVQNFELIGEKEIKQHIGHFFEQS